MSKQEKPKKLCNGDGGPTWPETPPGFPPKVPKHVVNNTSSKGKNPTTCETEEQTHVPVEYTRRKRLRCHSKESPPPPPSPRRAPSAASLDRSRANATHKSVSPTYDIGATIDISATKVPSPATSSPNVKKLSLIDWVSRSIDPKILQHVENALQAVAGNQPPVDNRKAESRSSNINESLAVLKAIDGKHGNIMQECHLESDMMKSSVLLGVCNVVRDLQKKMLCCINTGTLDSYYTAVKDAENANVNVQWLRQRLDEIKVALKLRSENSDIWCEVWRLEENINTKNNEILIRKVELDKLGSEIQYMKDGVARMIQKVTELKGQAVAQSHKIPLQNTRFLVDGLL